MLNDILDLDAALDQAADTVLTSEEDDDSSLDAMNSDDGDATDDEQADTSAADPEEASEESEPNAAAAGKPTDETTKPGEQPQETFTHIDPSTLPEEVKPVYKSLLGDYTRKRQAEAAEKRAMEQELNQLRAERHQQNSAGQPLYMGLTPEQVAAMSLQEYTQHTLNWAKQEAEANKVEEFEETAVNDFVTIDARINPEVESAYDPRLASYVGGRVDADYQAYIEQNGTGLNFDYRSSAQKYIGEWDAWVNSIKTTSVKETAQKSKAQAKVLQRKSPPSTTAKSRPSDKMDLDSAIESAFDNE